MFRPASPSSFPRCSKPSVYEMNRPQPRKPLRWLRFANSEGFWNGCSQWGGGHMKKASVANCGCQNLHKQKSSTAFQERHATCSISTNWPQQISTEFKKILNVVRDQKVYLAPYGKSFR